MTNQVTDQDADSKHEVGDCQTVGASPGRLKAELSLEAVPTESVYSCQFGEGASDLLKQHLV